MATTRFVTLWMVTSVMFPLHLAFAAEAGIKGDAEAAKHGFEAAQYQLLEEENESDFILRQYRREPVDENRLLATKASLMSAREISLLSRHLRLKPTLRW